MKANTIFRLCDVLGLDIGLPKRMAICACLLRLWSTVVLTRLQIWKTSWTPVKVAYLFCRYVEKLTWWPLS